MHQYSAYFTNPRVPELASAEGMTAFVALACLKGRLIRRELLLRHPLPCNSTTAHRTRTRLETHRLTVQGAGRQPRRSVPVLVLPCKIVLPTITLRRMGPDVTTGSWTVESRLLCRRAGDLVVGGCAVRPHCRVLPVSSVVVPILLGFRSPNTTRCGRRAPLPRPESRGVIGVVAGGKSSSASAAGSLKAHGLVSGLAHHHRRRRRLLPA
mmetsp:Transcript_74127/g.197640  ORF Transcript_74127/g.197640 Transcript_74127/m.197640 type:complete len:210 (-) Transcript_74127:475-1104(-)